MYWRRGQAQNNTFSDAVNFAEHSAVGALVSRLATARDFVSALAHGKISRWLNLLPPLALSNLVRHRLINATDWEPWRPTVLQRRAHSH
jgi:hypothetical protein